jgi:hypothetical protein
VKGDSRLVGPALEAVQQRPISISSLLGNRCFFQRGMVSKAGFTHTISAYTISVTSQASLLNT